MLSLTSANHNSTLMNTFTDYFEKGNYFDLTFVCGDNVKVKAHKMIIGTVSNFLKDMVSSEDGEVYINLPDVKSSDMKLLLKFLYGGTANVSQGELYRLKDVIFVLGINISNTVIRKTETVATSENSGVSLKQKENKKSRSVKRLPPITNIFQAAPQNVSDDPLDTPDIYDAPDVEDRVQPVVESIFSASSSFVPHAEASISASSSSFEEVVVKKEEIDPELSLEDSLLDADMGMFHQDHGSSTRKPKKRLLEPVITSDKLDVLLQEETTAKKSQKTPHDDNSLALVFEDLDEFVASQKETVSSSTGKSCVEMRDPRPASNIRSTSSKPSATNDSQTFLELSSEDSLAQVFEDFDEFMAHQKRKSPVATTHSSKKHCGEKSSPQSSVMPYHFPARNITMPSQQISESENVVLNYLQSCNEGRSLLTLYTPEKGLDQAGRRKLVNLIIRMELEDDPAKRMQSDRFLELATCIKSIYPMESISTYYIPYMNRGPNAKQLAKGKLVDCFYNRRREFKLSGLLTTRKRTSTEQNCSVYDVSTSVVDDGSAAEHVDWLRDYCEPWDMVENKWNITHNHRMKKLLDQSETVSSYMDKFPVLKKPSGYRLLLQDFKKMYPHADDMLIQNFPCYMQKILETAADRLKKVKDTAVLEALKECQQTAKFSKEAATFAAFMAMPLLLSSPVTTTARWRPSRLEARDSFIMIVANHDDIKEMVLRRKLKMENLGISSQPLIIGVGDNMAEINLFYIVVNDVYYAVRGALNAVDACFKIIHSLNVKYPKAASCIWQFVQQGFYNLQTVSDQSYVSVNALMSEMGMVFDK